MSQKYFSQTFRHQFPSQEMKWFSIRLCFLSKLVHWTSDYHKLNGTSNLQRHFANYSLFCTRVCNVAQPICIIWQAIRNIVSILYLKAFIENRIISKIIIPNAYMLDIMFQMQSQSNLSSSILLIPFLYFYLSYILAFACSAFE